MSRRNKERPSSDRKVNEFRSDIEQISRAHRPYENFVNFMEATYCAIAKRNALHQERADALEQRYMMIVERYGDNKREAMTRMANLLGELTLVIPDYHGDFLGDAYMTAGFGNERAGQFFTPYAVCSLMAHMNFDPDYVGRIKEVGRPITVSDPACGAGAQIIATAECLVEQGLDVQQYLLATLVDIDPLPFKMAYLQMTLKDIPAICVHGNSLTLEEFERAYTPAAIRLLRRNPGLLARDQQSDTAARPDAVDTAEGTQSAESAETVEVNVERPIREHQVDVAEVRSENPSTLELFPNPETPSTVSHRPRAVAGRAQLRAVPKPGGRDATIAEMGSAPDAAGVTPDLFASAAPTPGAVEEMEWQARATELERVIAATHSGEQGGVPTGRLEKPNLIRVPSPPTRRPSLRSRR
jgi:hypothetical protein